MADKETAALPAAAPLGAGDILHIVQGGNSRKATPGQIRDHVDNYPARYLARGAAGSHITAAVIEEEFALSGASAVSSQKIWARQLCLGVSVRVTQAITGAPSFGVGIAGEPTKFGGSLGVSLGSTNIGIIGPTPFYSDTPIVITPTSGVFTGGLVRISIHVLGFGAPMS